MKYTAIESCGIAQIKPVSGCLTCPHKEDTVENGNKIMVCRHAGKKRKLIGNWAGSYHASCSLPGAAQSFSLEGNT